jgi:hypothetical protein
MAWRCWCSIAHPIARGRAGPKLLAHILFSKSGLHPPLNPTGGRGGGHADAAGRDDPHPCLRGRAHPRRRHQGADGGRLCGFNGLYVADRKPGPMIEACPLDLRLRRPDIHAQCAQI